MTDDEKGLLKEMSKMICDLVFLVGVYEAVVKRHVGHWREEVAAANASPAFQSLRREIESTRQSIDLLIDENNLSALLTKLPKCGLVN